MGRFVNPDNSAFQVALNSPIYVDKTGLLEYTNSVLNTTEAYICNCRPRRFGKSYAANMLAAYYSKGCNSEEMFSGLDISRESDFKMHLNKYDVIHLDIQWFLANCDNVDNVVAFITKSVQAELREIYPGVLPEEETSLSESLSRIKNIVGQKFIIIIDEWDVLIRDEAANKKVQELLESYDSIPLNTGTFLTELIRRPELDYDKLAPIDPERPDLPAEVAEQVNISIKYDGYIKRQMKQVESFKKLEKKKIPENFNYDDVPSLRIEARQKLKTYSPTSIGQASRISGVSPADVSVLLVYMEQMKYHEKESAE